MNPQAEYLRFTNRQNNAPAAASQSCWRTIARQHDQAICRLSRRLTEPDHRCREGCRGAQSVIRIPTLRLRIIAVASVKHCSIPAVCVLHSRQSWVAAMEQEP